jgi:phosphoserine aminotransferase
MRVMNFNAGPATLPLPALERARDEMLDFASSGMSVMEHSHRGKEYEAVHHEASALLRELLGIPASYDVLFLQGGASMQFAQIPMNFLGQGKVGEYVVNGTWGEKAVGEGKVTTALLGGSVHVAATTGTGDGKEKSYTRANKQAELSLAKPDAGAAAYLHFTSNETIHGVQYGTHPDVPLLSAPAGVPLICDMSSDFLWRKVDVSPYAFIYAGAQKNIGPSGVLVVLAQKDFVAGGRKDLPKIFQYRTAAENDSLYNTPPTFGIYLVRNVLAWVKEKGGLSAIEAQNRAKAKALYGAIDGHGGFYRCPVEASSRSVMNVVFRLPTEALEDKFVAAAKKHQMVGLKGHRSVGGIRVSTYNAVPLEWVTALADFMKQFAKEHG